MKDAIIKRFNKGMLELTKYYRKLINKAKSNYIIGSINEWIVDNFYLIVEQEKHINNDYLSREIRRIPTARKEKIYNLVESILEACDFNVNKKQLFSELKKYQEENNDYFSYLEINLIYIFLRMIIIMRLHKLSLKLNNRLNEQEKIERLFKVGKTSIDLDLPKDIENHYYYIELLNNKLKQLGNSADDAFEELNRVLEKHNLSLKEVISESQNDLAKDNILMVNIFSSIKKVSKFKLEYLYEKISFTEQLLIREDNIYNNLYEDNKFDYRNKIIKEAKRKKINEYDYAKKLIDVAKKEENKHIGWFLFKKPNYELRIVLYILGIVVGTVFLSLVLANFLGKPLFFLLVIPVSSLVIEIINQILMKIVPTKRLFKLKFEDKIPKEYSTMVVIPTIIKDTAKVRAMFEALETYYLSNKSDNLYFTLLGDASSEDKKLVGNEEEIKQAGIKKVNELNEKYGKKIFYFIYRNRFYSESEECYLGFERKRGALHHFNKLLLGKLSKEEREELFYVDTFDDFDVPIKYVITLDTDTKLVLNTVFKLVGAMAHPMNQPVLSKDKRKVIDGYAIMQPRIGIDVLVTNKSQYSQLYAGLGGLDTYTTACFDLYQDVFGEGSFVGKGIYDLEVFDEVLGDAFPDNLILSHDLLEGNYLRCGFLSDVELFDDYPSSYLNDAARHHRWNRGDWQIISWLKRKVRNRKKEKVKNPVTILEKWKIFDNLRRSLVSFFLLLIIFYGFSIGIQSPIYYIGLVAIIIATPIFFYLLNRLIYRHKYDLFLKYYLNLIRGIFAVVNKSLIQFALLPYETELYIDSICKALYRMYISKKRLLNWITAEEIEKMLKNTLKTYLLAFRINYIAAILLVIFTAIFKIEYIYFALIIAVFWLLAPVLLYHISRPIKSDTQNLNTDQKRELFELAARTWKYFSNLLNEENNYLIPDNYQFNRASRVDDKTSPTNIGFSLVSIVSAAEFDLISKNEAIKLIGNILKTVNKLEKWNGHLYNWYNIKTCEKMYPFFISSVDNGNFIASLYVVKGFLKHYGGQELQYLVDHLIEEMKFKMLYNQETDVFSIGYQGSDQTLLPYSYNNFASESRLTSFIAIAKGDVPYKHWFCLDKTLTRYKFYKGVASWMGSAFEYFMPLIFMKTFKHTLLDETYYFAYYAHREFMREIDPDLPWGISEAACDELDDSENYKYRSFGIPYLKLRESSKDYRIVVSPYSSIMAISIADKEVYNNIQKFKKLGMYGVYGLYESYDYDDRAIIKAYYAHHQGMILASLTNYLKDNIIQEYFHSDKRINSIEMLLKEKVQIKPYINKKAERYKKQQYPKEQIINDVREYSKLSDISEVGVLSNGNYAVVLNDRGVGFSKYKNLYVNRYRNASDEDCGIFLYICNLNTNKVWSNTYAPLYTEPGSYKVTFASDRIKYVREDDGIVTNTEIAVVKDHEAEIRKITFQNNTNEDVELEVTSYGEVIMCRNEVDIAHRAFNSITISTEFDQRTQSLIFTRKSKTKENTRYFIVSRLFTGDERETVEFETNRINFIGRNNNVSNPEVIMNNIPLQGTYGASLDPIMALRQKVTVKSQGKKTIYLLVGFGKSKEQIKEIVDTYCDETSIESAFDMITVLNNMRNSYAGLSGNQIKLFNQMLKHVYSVTNKTEKRALLLAKNKLTKKDLWKFGISGDLPIILTRINSVEDLGFINHILKAYEFFKSRALYFDFVIINGETLKKEILITNHINKLLHRIHSSNYFENLDGGVHIISANNLTPEEETLLKIVAHVEFTADDKTLEEQLRILDSAPVLEVLMVSQRIAPKKQQLPEPIDFYNGYGGFVEGGREYLITRVDTPVPWANIISNDDFGTVVTNSLGGFTFAYNSREFKLTSWSNDLVYDPSSEQILIDNKVFVPTQIKHGFGYTIYSSITNDYEINIKEFVAKDDYIKFYEVEVTNKKSDKTKIDISLALKLVLGVALEYEYRYLDTTFDEKNNVYKVTNTYNSTFRNKLAYLTATEKLKASEYKKNTVLTVSLELLAKATKTFSFVLGTCDKENFESLNLSFDQKQVSEEFMKVKNYWDEKLNKIQINTPDKSFNYVMNGWYLYQTYASRLLAKAGLYQVGGATGFRDQLQDVLAILNIEPERARKQILTHAAHQFKEGDVLHWWHEELMFGSRTKFSDDYLWLPYVTLEYLKITGDSSIIKEQVPFVEGEKLKEYELEKGIHYSYTEETDTLLNHIKLAIERSLNRFGRHNLPLIGSGDWNDGMNKVGEKGFGESVFVAMFLYDILEKIKLYDKEFGKEFIDLCESKSKELYQAIQKNAWDGEWFIRAYFDNGEVIGSRNNIECRIDLLCQAWAILANVATPDQQDRIVREVEKNLVDKEGKIIKLLTPAFRNIRNNPGYIKDYIVGTRENGGQYTHAALWYIMALIKLKKAELAYNHYQMINPINRTQTEEGVNLYKTEPYVIAADIYSHPIHLGRGGWTWYTGSAGWAYKVGLEEIIGFKKEGDFLTIDPHINPEWKNFTINYKYLSTDYVITVINENQVSSGVIEVTLDNKEIKDNKIKLVDDGKTHEVIVRMGEEK